MGLRWRKAENALCILKICTVTLLFSRYVGNKTYFSMGLLEEHEKSLFTIAVNQKNVCIIAFMKWLSNEHQINASNFVLIRSKFQFSRDSSNQAKRPIKTIVQTKFLLIKPNCVKQSNKYNMFSTTEKTINRKKLQYLWLVRFSVQKEKDRNYGSGSHVHGLDA